MAAAALYLLLGDPNSLDGYERQNQTASKEVEQMVAGLVEKLKKEPNNPKGWAMLARSYKVMGRPVDAEKAYEAAQTYIANDAQLLADYADVVASNANGSFVGKPEKLIQQALVVDPNNAMALWLSVRRRSMQVVTPRRSRHGVICWPCWTPTQKMPVC
jgi:cytochrome c-type biogenesis protein CcmH